ncbi:MAG: Na+/H+ antiporter subunit E [Candidatus Saelkia tenebricola]|nr:Na+/H+ antiporter subunit E [Candidatus Saelkia tenebricola]
MKAKCAFFIIALIIWILLNIPLNVSNLIIGVVVSVFAAYFVGDFFPQRPHLLFHPARYFWFFLYIPIFVWQCLKANVDVALRIIRPSRPINPGIVKVQTSLKSDIALTFLANSITLTPGTLTIDLNKEEGVLYVHWIDVKSVDIKKATELIVGKFEKILKKIFEE